MDGFDLDRDVAEKAYAAVEALRENATQLAVRFNRAPKGFRFPDAGVVIAARIEDYLCAADVLDDALPVVTQP